MAYGKIYKYYFGDGYVQFCDGSAINNVQPRKYNGKEFDNMHGLNTYDYGARQYDPTAPRFITPDPLAEKFYKWNYFTYCGNNPIRFIDPDGRIPFDKSVEHKRISSLFGIRKHPITGGLKRHGGIDLATEGTGHGVQWWGISQNP